MHFAQARQACQEYESRIRNALALIKLDLLQGRHPAEYREAAIRDLSQSSVIVVQLQSRDVLRSNVRCIAAIHARQTVQTPASSYMAEGVIVHADRRQFLKHRKVRQGRERLVIHLLATDAETA